MHFYIYICIYVYTLMNIYKNQGIMELFSPLSKAAKLEPENLEIQALQDTIHRMEGGDDLGCC